MVHDLRERQRAIDPARSFIVQAPAGSGKTTLLVTRFLHLLGLVTRPEQLLAITFTRKAAQEMRSRILEALEAQATPEARAALARDETLGWGLRDNPNRLRVQTIDAFAISITRQMPFSAGVARDPAIIENATPLYERAATRLLLRLRPDQPLDAYVARFLALHDNNAAVATRLLVTMLARRDQWLDAVTELLVADERQARHTHLNAAIGRLHENARRRLTAALGASGVRDFDEAVADAAAGITGARPSLHLAARTFLTHGGSFRKRLTRREGFVPGSPAQARATEVLEVLRARGLEELLADLGALPMRLSADEADDLVAVCATLSLALLELSELFRETGQTDFTELLLGARRALTGESGVSDLMLALDYRIRHILIDEFQDTSQAQYRLFETLVDGWGGTDATVFAVGDPMQSIYRFRGADVSLYLHAAERGIGQADLEKIPLTTNFRSNPGLVHWFNRVFARVMGTEEDPVTGRIAHTPSRPAHADPRQPDPASAPGAMHGPELCRFPDSGSEIDALVARIATHATQRPADSVALLLRSRAHVAPLLPVLRAAGIRWQATDIDALAETPVVADLLCMVKALADPQDRLAWMSLLRAPFVGLSMADLQICAGCRRFTPSTLAAVGERVSASGAERLTRFIGALSNAVAAIDEMPPRSVLERLWLACGGGDAYAPADSHAHAERLLELVDTLGPAGLDSAVLGERVADLFASDPEPAQLQIMTLHKAKGLEFDHVLLPFLDRTTRPPETLAMQWRSHAGELLAAVDKSGRDGEPGLFGWLKREESAREREEVKRLLYVACTRARQSLYLSAVSPSTKPAPASMLHLLWPEFSALTESAKSAAPSDASRPERCTTMKPIHRLPDGYVWSDEPLGRLHLAMPTPSPETGVANEHDVALGTLVHEILRQLSQTTLPGDANAWCAAAAGTWRARLVELGASAVALAAHLPEAERQILGVLADPTGRWLLAARDQAHSEYPLAGVDAGVVIDVIIDRTFDDGGVRWVIDYKSTQPVGPLDTFVANQVARHRAQLERYARFIANVRDDRPGGQGKPVRTALYLTALPRLVMLDDAPMHG